jgi:hypothetical protein
LEPNRHFTLKMDSNVCDGFIHHKHPDSYYGSLFCNLFHDAVCIYIMTQIIQSHSKQGTKFLPSSNWLMSKQYRYSQPVCTVHAIMFYNITYRSLIPIFTHTGQKCGKYTQKFIFIPQRSVAFNAVTSRTAQSLNTAVYLCAELYPIGWNSKKYWQNLIYVLKQSMAFTAPICKKVTTS